MSEFFQKFFLSAGIDLDEDYFIHRGSRNPNVVMFINVISYIGRLLDRKFQAYFSFISSVLFLFWEESCALLCIWVDYLHKSIILNQEVPSFIVEIIFFFSYLSYSLDKINIDLCIILDEIGLLFPANLEIVFTCADYGSLDTVILLWLEIVEAMIPFWCFGEIIDFIGHVGVCLTFE
jgi:hypothetical protein